jgi:uncharacterized protein (TIGR02266 family)
VVAAKRWKVLLADDVELFLELEKTFLQREDIELVVARDGEEALAAIRRERPDLILLDLYMPGMDGDEVCREVKADPLLRATPVLMVTSAGRDDERARCEHAGSEGILTKPINRHLFLDAVRGRLSVAERGAHRVPARLQVRFGPGGGHVLTDFTVNVSTGGVFIETSQRFAAGDPLQTSFVLPEREKPVSCRSRVAWVNTAEQPTTPTLPPGIGVQFLDIAAEDRAAILAFVKEKLLSPLW